MVLFRKNNSACQFNFYLSPLECKPSRLVAVSVPVATLILAGVLWALRNRSRAPIAAFLFFTATLFPVLGFFNVYPFRYSFVADHFQYLACIGPIVLLVLELNGHLVF